MNSTTCGRFHSDYFGPHQTSLETRLVGQRCRRFNTQSPVNKLRHVLPPMHPPLLVLQGDKVSRREIGSLFLEQQTPPNKLCRTRSTFDFFPSRRKVLTILTNRPLVGKMEII